jgi:hypothetical protein
MNEYANYIDILPLENVAFVNGNILTLFINATFDRMLVEEFSFSPSTDTSDAGTLTSINQTFYAEKCTDVIALRYHKQRPCIIQLTKTDGTTLILGSKPFPIYVNILPGIQRNSIYASLKTPEPLSI